MISLGQAIYSAWGFVSYWVRPVERAIISMLPAATSPTQKRDIMAVSVKHWLPPPYPFHIPRMLILHHVSHVPQVGLSLGTFVGLVGGVIVAAVASFEVRQRIGIQMSVQGKYGMAKAFSFRHMGSSQSSQTLTFITCSCGTNAQISRSKNWEFTFSDGLGYRSTT